jgi:cell division septation protein DedD
MPATECATEIALPNTQNDGLQPEDTPPVAAPGSKLLKGLLWGFAATVTIGLALASWYVGVRIVASDQMAPSSAISRGSTNTAPALPALAPPAVAEDPIPEAFRYAVPPADLYLQTTGLGLKPDAGFVRALQTKGFNARVQAEDDNHSRILIGPFSSQAEMEQVRRTLQAAGVLSVETAH